MERWANIKSNIAVAYAPPSVTDVEGHQAFCRSYQTSRDPKEILAQSMGLTLHDLKSRWNISEPYNVRKHLFIVGIDRKMLPAFNATPEVYKHVIDSYVSWYKIPQHDMKEFWCDFVDSLLVCHEFEEKASTEFKAWAYGRLCRYVLVERQQKRMKTAEAYDPESNFS